MKKIQTKTQRIHFTILLIFFLLSISVLSSCDEFIETDPPASQLFGKDVFEDRTTANAALAGIYAKLRDTGPMTGSMTGIGCRLGLYADELEYFQVGTPNNFYSDALHAAEPGVLDLWNQSYNQVYSANAALAGIAGSHNLEQADKDQLKGEALFIRALIHFYLVNLFGDIPYIQTTDYHQNKVVSRLSTQDVYTHIVSDLTLAASLLPDTYITPARTRPNKAAVSALLARVYLYTGQWAEASETASSVINNGNYVWENDLDKVFLKESTATIWQLSPGNQAGNTIEAQLFIFASGPPPFAALNSNFMQSFEPGDLRQSHWTRGVTSGSQVWYHAYKYKQNQPTATSVEHSIILRLDEQYLIRAEARAMEGDIIGAQEDLNKFRSRAGLSGTEAVSEVSLVEAILAERMHELFTEYGHRFMDLKRLARIDTTLANVKLGWNGTDKLWPIPAQELLTNPNLNPQNDGY